MSYTILVADDEPAIRTMLEVVLAADGHQVITVADGPAALAYLQDHTPDAMLLDLNMPRVSGLELAQQVKQLAHLQHTAVLLLTGQDDQHTREQAQLVGVDELLLKPVSGKILRSQLSQLIEQRKARAGSQVVGNQPSGSQT